MPLGTTPRAETACPASHARPTWPDEPSKLDRQQGFGYSSILDRRRLFFLYALAYTAAGLTPDCGSTWTLPQLIGLPRALDLALTNRAITGATALEWGLASRAVPREQLEDTLAEVLDGLRRASFPAVSRTKQLMRAASGRDRSEALDAEAASTANVINGPDGIEGVDAFLAKRTPQFD